MRKVFREKLPYGHYSHSQRLDLDLDVFCGHIRLATTPGRLSGWVLLCVFGAELGTTDDAEVFDPSKLDPNRCESCYGAESDDLK